MEDKAVNLDAYQAAISGLTSSDITAITGVAIALCALVVSIFQIKQSNKVSRIQLMPSLCFSSEVMAGSAHFNVVMTNSGLGPAFVESFKVYLDGQKLTVSNPLIVAVMTVLKTEKFHLTSMSIEEGMVFKEGYSTSILALTFHEKQNDKVINWWFDELSKRISIEIDYKDAFGKRMQTLKS